jgi:hypothetical protein
LKTQILRLRKSNNEFKMAENNFISSITFLRLRITFEAIEPITLPSYKGSSFRGCLGETLRVEVCKPKLKNCEPCKEKFDCAFSQLYNSYVLPEHPHYRKFSKSPHPYIINPFSTSQTHYKIGETFGFELTLIGKASEYLPLMLRVFSRMGEIGIGENRGKFKPFKLETLTKKLEYADLPFFGKCEEIQLSDLHIPKEEKQLTLQFETPLRFMVKGKLLQTEPDFDLFISRLHQRLMLLAYFYCGADWVEPDQSNANIQIQNSELHQVDWRRYSGTQDTSMYFDGLLGTITYKGENLNNWMPMLTLGTWLHAGSTATFGLGKFKLLEYKNL